MMSEKFNPSWNHWLHGKTNFLAVQRIKLVVSSEFTVAKFLIYSSVSSFTFVLKICRPTLKRNFVKENKKPFTAIKATTSHKNSSQRYNCNIDFLLTYREALRKLEILSCSGYMVEDTLAYKAMMHWLKSMFSYQLALLCLVTFEGYLLRTMVLFVRGRETDRRKTLKNEEKGK